MLPDRVQLFEMNIPEEKRFLDILRAYCGEYGANNVTLILPRVWKDIVDNHELKEVITVVFHDRSMIKVEACGSVFFETKVNLTDSSIPDNT